MARRKLTDTSHPDGQLVDEYWLRFSEIAQPAMRDKIVYLTFEEIAKVGPGAFNVATVCDRLGVTYPMVNHYFGSRDGLLAEGAFRIYRNYITQLWEAVSRAEKEPKARLEAWMWEQVRRTEEMGGWASILNHPYASTNVSLIMRENYEQQMQELFELNLGRLSILVSDVQSGRVTDLPQSIDPATRSAIVTNPTLAETVASVAWSTFGVSVWNSGQHLPSFNIPEMVQHKERFIKAHIDRVIASI
jgi:AcrR family transcriptional regulator